MGVTILRNAAVLDAERGELAEGLSVVVENGRIADVGPGLAGPGDAVLLDIRPATTTAARLLRLAGQVGVVAPGALADLLVIDGNPLDDIRVLTTPEATLKLIMKEGRVYKNEL